MKLTTDSAACWECFMVERRNDNYKATLHRNCGHYTCAHHAEIEIEHDCRSGRY